MALKEFLSTGLSFGILGWTAKVFVDFISRCTVDWIKNKRQAKQIAKEEEKSKKDKLKIVIEKIYFLLNDLDRVINRLHLLRDNFIFSKKNTYDLLVEADNTINIKIFNDLEYIFNFKIINKQYVLAINNLEKFWRNAVILLHKAILRDDSLINLNIKESKENYTYIELECFLINEMENDDMDFKSYYPQLKLYYCFFKNNVISFLKNL